MEQLGDRIVASISIPGFLARLDDEHRILFENALAVFYQRAQVQLVREQLEAELGSRAHYDIADEGLVVWPEPGYELEVVYRLGAYRPKALKPKPFSRATSLVLDSRRVLFSHQQISWSAWEAIWRAYENPTEPVRRLLLGPSLLPPGPATAAHIAHGA